MLTRLRRESMAPGGLSTPEGMSIPQSTSLLHTFGDELRSIVHPLSAVDVETVAARLRQLERRFLNLSESDAQRTAIRQAIATERLRTACNLQERLDVCRTRYAEALNAGFLDAFEMVTMPVIYSQFCESHGNTKDALSVLDHAQEEVHAAQFDLQERDVNTLSDAIARQRSRIAE